MTGRAILAGLAAVFVAGISQFFTSDEARECVQDGLAVQRARSVVVTCQGRGEVRLCSVDCAMQWLPHENGVTEIVVHDEQTGEPLAAHRAHYVETSNQRLHAFSRWTDAHDFAERSAARVVPDPLTPWMRDPTKLERTSQD